VLSLLGFLLILGPLVVVHEFGHYIFARLFNVKAEIFSIGFGPRLWSRQLGETELRVSAVPLGGYVKLLGEENDADLSPADQKRALQRQKPWKRFFIFFGGPLFNFLFAIFVFMVILVIGEPQMASVVGRAVRGSAAEKAGFQSGDRILAVGGVPVKRFEEVILAVNESPGRPLRFEVLHPRSESPATVTVTPTAQDGFSVYGEATHVGEIGGLLPTARANPIGVSDPSSPAGKAGIRTGDKLVELDGAPVANWEEVERVFDAYPAGRVFSVTIEPADPKAARRTVEFKKPAARARLGESLGLHSTELFVERTVEKSPAASEGIRTGDRLLGVGNLTVESFFELKDAVQRAGEKDGKVTIHWEREGKRMKATVTPTATNTRDPILKKTVQYTVGVVPMLTWAEPAIYLDRTWNPFLLVFKATERMAVFSWRNIVSLRKMFTGDVSVATLGGPILIGKLAGESLSRGLIDFLRIMAILSVGLGILNILPIPVLDGGHLLLLAIESVRGRPLTIRQMEIVQQVGLSLILLLMVIVIRNDLARLPIFD
jgi:regulator of sigma E protease